MVMTRAPSQGGFSYLSVIFAVAVLGLLLAGSGQVWHTAAMREKEAELLFIGNQYRQALASYHRHTPGTAGGEYPKTLADLLEDKRYPMPMRHLRRLYPDPMTGALDWVPVLAGDRIAGLHSRSDARPFKVAFDERDAAFADAEAYSAWVFMADQAAPVTPVNQANQTNDSSPPAGASAQ